MQLVLFQESAFEVLHAGFEERLRFVAGDVLGNVGAASFCMAHLAQDSSIRAGDAFDRQHRAVAPAVLTSTRSCLRRPRRNRSG